MRLLIKIASRERPDALTHVLRACDMLLSHAPDQVRILLSLDSDDESMLGYQPEPIANVPITMCYSHSESKVHAINRDIPGFLWYWDVLLVLADDMVPVLGFFDAAILEAMRFKYPDLDGALWFGDSRQRRVCTIPVMGRNLWERRSRQVYNRAYKAYKCDDEETERCVAEGCISLVSADLARHDHPMFFTHPKDGLLKRNKAFKLADKKTYDHRLKQGYAA